ncbi:hypothetical protein [Sulfitobacter sp. S190]|uniref:hypothetical protein n=1 Tax=Sulfitobacter sp. S190 TaxID=2867022 RepID=UPI0021A7F8A9|nr:hypothetical protein [Sulfitobacter sp. S190]UWR21749.1 hypothetical protein K3756_13790 [Sulfitobacter sp. S190]
MRLFLVLLSLVFAGAGAVQAQERPPFNAWPALARLDATDLSRAEFDRVLAQAQVRTARRDRHRDDRRIAALETVEAQVLTPQAGEDFEPQRRATADRHRQGCIAGQARDCLVLGEMYRRGDGVWIDADVGAVTLELACIRGLMAGCHGLIEEVDLGIYRPEREPLIGAFEVACDKADARACAYLAGRLESEAAPVARDLERAEAFRARARDLARKGCAAGDGAACFTRYRIAQGDGIRRAFPRYDAFDLPEPDAAEQDGVLQAGCDLGHGQSCAWLGERKRTQKDAAQALFEAGCDLGDATACRRAGRPGDAPQAADACTFEYDSAKCQAAMPRPHARLATSWEEAQAMSAANRSGRRVFEAVMTPELFLFQPRYHGQIRRLARACKDTDYAACAALADTYITLAGRGFDWGHHDGMADTETSGAILQSLCEAGDARGCTLFGHSQSGRGDLERPDLFLPAWQRGCDLGASESCTALAGAFLTGNYVGVDEAKATALAGRACDLGDVLGCQRLVGYNTRDPSIYGLANLRACLEGVGNGCIILAREYDRGREGFRRDRRFADRLRRVACAVDPENGCR